MPRSPMRYNTLIIGVDPGSSGGITSILQGKVTARPMPQTEHDLWDYFSELARHEGPMYAMIEYISTAMYGVDKSSMSKLYGNYRACRMCLVAAGIPFEEVKPLAWQRGLRIEGRRKGESTGQWKKRLQQCAQNIFPRVKRLTLATSDSALIAEFNRRTRLW